MFYNKRILDLFKRYFRFNSHFQEEVKYSNSRELKPTQWPIIDLQLCISRSVLFHFDWIIRVHIVLDNSLINKLCKCESKDDQSVLIVMQISYQLYH